MVTQEKRIEELMLEAEKAPEPGKDILIENTSEMPEMTIKELNSAGWVYMYDTQTGERRLTNKNMLSQQLGKLRPDGTRYFTTIKPPFAKKIAGGMIKCLLHGDNPNRKHYNEMGLPVCKKANLVSTFQMRLHMQKKHKMEWAAIEEERTEAEKAEERELRQIILRNSITVRKENTK